MKMRIMGRRDECAAMTALIRETVPEKYIRTISGFYPNRGISTEGRVYIEFDTPPAFNKPVVGRP